MSKCLELKFEEFNEWFSYDPITGELSWKKNKGSVRVGDKAGSLTTDGYYHVKFNGKRYKTHRVCYLLNHGSIDSSLVIDHIDSNKLNNKADNLRLVVQKTNSRNCKISKNNTTGVNGVCYNKRDKIWYTSIKVDRKKIYLGTFDTLEEAAKARKEADIKYGFYEDHGAKKEMV